MTTDTDTNRGSFTEDEMSSLDDEGMEQNRTERCSSKEDGRVYNTYSHRPSRVSKIPEVRAALKRDYTSLPMSRKKQLEELENHSNSSEIKQIRSTLIESDKYLNRICKIVEQPSSSDPDSDYEPANKSRHRRYASNKFTHCTQHRVRLVKSDYNPDFGFSISDSAYEPGIYIHQVKPGGPAETNGLKPYDRIIRASYHTLMNKVYLLFSSLLQINEYPVRQLDCSRVLPLLGMCGNEVNLVISRSLQTSNGHHLLQQTEEI